ncbi:MAG TPA: TlpA disulfide reductase family protein [Phycisphaerae bacterium]|jgi:peroxiredoxin|nr:TlpA disulfide reductase family protein [Phycisphaerae bacterium]HOJ54867.1 TlpA disulfide reductase family protein [Phycisphaerae bacterium]HOL26053.1 TlpA disulfide reductase family protein [Phycisphaerae bacterium]HPP21507.1 TlpA disulfide reductase family protein [Phycisphaerae bacterium]HPU31517.1 TlpA disulfide reductase family protein [Phycisphaerae bacterium]
MSKLGLIVVIMVAIVLIVLVVLQFTAAPPSPPSPPPTNGMAAPDASSVMLDGRKWRLADQRGKVVLLDFWATWCPPCVASIPELKKIHDTFKDHPDFLLVGVSGDEEKSALESFIQKREIPWLQLFDMAGDYEMSRKFDVTLIPTTFLIDRQGNIAAKNLPTEQLIKEIERLLKAPA